MKDLLSLIFNIINDGIKYREIRDSDRRTTSHHFGVRAIIVSLLVPLGVFLLTVCYQSIQNGGNTLWGVIASIFGILLGIALPLVALLRGTVYVILQLRLNRKPISWVALGIYCLALGGAILLFTSTLS
jgi:uncharacterized membrane protein YGL010W